MITVGSLVQAVRRDAAQAQADFRILLDVLSRPGTVGRLDIPAGVPAAVVPVAGLADVEVPLAVVEGGVAASSTEGDVDADWGRVLALATGAPLAEMERARLLLALRPLTGDEVARLERGDAMHPEHGTRLVLAVEEFGTGLPLRLTGPGVPGAAELAVRGLPAATVRALAAANAEFPAGIDTFLVARDGGVAGLPRSTSIEIGES